MLSGLTKKDRSPYARVLDGSISGLGQTIVWKIHIRIEEGLHRRLRICSGQLDTTIQDFVVRLLDR
jgi:hypothetical protein